MKKEDLNIVCFLWHGDRWNSEDNGHEYVNVLFNSVERNLSIPHKFICMTNIPDGLDKNIEILPLNAPSWKGCLPKISMYNPDLGLQGYVLSLDIDIIITGSLDQIASYRGNFAVRSAFRDPFLLDGDIVGFKVGYMTDQLWAPMKLNPLGAEKRTGGRERFWYRQQLGTDKIDRYQTLFPGQLLSYKNHLRGGKELPANARIVSCHGHPRPHELKENWAKKHWR